MTSELRRSVDLIRAFRHEQTEPGRFYRHVASDSVGQVQRWRSLDGATVLDVGGGPGFFADAFRAAGATYLAIDADAGELAAEPGPGTVVGSALALPIRDASIDVCYSSNVLEHVSDPNRMGSEMIRVTRPGGLVHLSFTVWWGPWGGHETSPWHLLIGGQRAALRYERTHGHPPKNVYGTSLFAVRVGEALAWARGVDGARLIAAQPRYLPPWSRHLLRVPGLREVATWNLQLVLECA
jgi:SAM-dependent methyltransferase